MFSVAENIINLQESTTTGSTRTTTMNYVRMSTPSGKGKLSRAKPKGLTRGAKQLALKETSNTGSARICRRGWLLRAPGG